MLIERRRESEEALEGSGNRGEFVLISTRLLEKERSAASSSTSRSQLLDYKNYQPLLSLPPLLSSFSSHHAEDSLPKLERVTWFFLMPCDYSNC
jgi:hypothetical protein